jgi:Helix-turn-helix domain of resolvase.
MSFFLLLLAIINCKDTKFIQNQYLFALFTAIGQKVGSDIETLKNEVETIATLHDQGHSYAMIADELGITVRTIYNKKNKLNFINKKNSKNNTPTTTKN